MGNLKQTKLQRTEERKAEDRSEKDRTRRITKKLQEEKKWSSVVGAYVFRTSSLNDKIQSN